MAGLDIEIFKPHRVRAASTSKAKKSGATIQTILRAAGWTNKNTFAKFYDKPVTASEMFANIVLKESNC